MQNIFNLNQPGFSKFVSVSVLLHVIAAIVAVFLVKDSEKRVFITPSFTEIELLSPTKTKQIRPKAKKISKPKLKEPAKPKPVKKASPKPVERPKAKPAKKAVTIKKPDAVITPPPVKPIKLTPEKPLDLPVKVAVPEPAKPVERIKEPETPRPTEAEEQLSIDSALSRLENTVKQKDEDLLIARRIEELEMKAAQEREYTQQKLSELKEDIAYDVAIEADEESVEEAFASAREGVSRQLFDMEFKEYYKKVSEKTQSRWVYSGGSGEGLQTIISIKVDPTGMLIDYWIEKRSGNDLFDSSALKAIRKAAPYPPIPAELTSGALEIGLRFCPGGCK